MIKEVEIPAGYKQTEIGTVPSDWEVFNVGDLLTVKHGKSQHEVIDVNGDYPILATGGQIGNAKSYIYNKPSVLIGRKGTIDEPQYIETPFWSIDTLFYTEIFEKSIPKFIYYKFKTINWYAYNEASGVPSLNAKTIEKIRISIPSLQEQTAITSALSETDSLIKYLEKLIIKKRHIKQGTMQELLTGRKRLAGFEGNWETKLLGDISDINTGKKNNDDKIEEGLYPFFVRSQTIERINSYSFDGEAILMPGEGNIGRIYHYINGKFDYHQRVYKISNFGTNICGKYIYYKMLHNFNAHAMKNTVKATVDSLRLPTFQRFEVSLPPQLEEQKAVANILSDIEIEIEILREKLHKYIMIKQGMMRVLLTGKIRLS